MILRSIWNVLTAKNVVRVGDLVTSSETHAGETDPSRGKDNKVIVLRAGEPMLVLTCEDYSMIMHSPGYICCVMSSNGTVISGIVFSQNEKITIR